VLVVGKKTACVLGNIIFHCRLPGPTHPIVSPKAWQGKRDALLFLKIAVLAGKIIVTACRICARTSAATGSIRASPSRLLRCCGRRAQNQLSCLRLKRVGWRAAASPFIFPALCSSRDRKTQPIRHMPSGRALHLRGIVVQLGFSANGSDSSNTERAIHAVNSVNRSENKSQVRTALDGGRAGR